MNQEHLETIFNLELKFNFYRTVMNNNNLTSQQHRDYCFKTFEEFKPFIENYLKTMETFHLKQDEKQEV